MRPHWQKTLWVLLFIVAGSPSRRSAGSGAVIMIDWLTEPRDWRLMISSALEMEGSLNSSIILFV